MKLQEVVELENIRDRAGKLLNMMEAETMGEWEAIEKLTSAHKQLRSIDTGLLRQGKLNLE